MMMYRSTGSKKKINRVDWEQQLNDVKVGRDEMNKLVMNFLVSEGHVHAVERFRLESGIEPDVDLETITKRMVIKKDVQSGNVKDAIEKVTASDPEIFDAIPQLFFHLHQQRMIELIRNGETEAALEFGQKELAPWGEQNPAFLEELERTVALLAFEDPTKCPVSELLDISQRHKIARELNAALLVSEDREKDPKLSWLLKTLTWVQEELDAKATYPRINDPATATLEDNV